MGGRVADIASLAALHVVVDGDGSHIFVAIAVHEGGHVDDHLSVGLIPDHLAEDGRADGAPDPVLLTFEVIEATLVEKMAARKTNDVLVALLH